MALAEKFVYINFSNTLLMFALTESDRQKSIIGIGDGPASFNAEMTAASYQVVSIDPIYQFTTDEIKSRFDACVDNIRACLRSFLG